MNEILIKNTQNNLENCHENYIHVPASIAYKVTTETQLNYFNNLFGLKLLHEEVFCYPALYVAMLGSFICSKIDEEDCYKNLGYHIVEIL